MRLNAIKWRICRLWPMRIGSLCRIGWGMRWSGLWGVIIGMWVSGVVLLLGKWYRVTDWGTEWRWREYWLIEQSTIVAFDWHRSFSDDKGSIDWLSNPPLSKSTDRMEGVFLITRHSSVSEDGGSINYSTDPPSHRRFRPTSSLFRDDGGSIDPQSWQSQNHQL